MHSILHSAEKSVELPAAAPERWLLAACLSSLLLALFLAQFDDPLLRAVYGLTHAENAAWWRGVSLLGSGLALTPVVATAALVLLWRNQSPSALALAFGWAATSLTVEYLKWLLDRGRPPVTAWSVARGNAFPSGHAAAAVYLCLSLGLGFLAPAAAAGRRYLGGFLGKSCWAILLGIPVAVGYSRVALGVHWASDVAAGWAVGLFFCAFARVLRRPDQRREIQSRSPESGAHGES